MSSLLTRINTRTEQVKKANRAQAHFDQGIQRSSNSSIRGEEKITTFEPDTQVETKFGTISQTYKCKDFEVFIEALAPDVNIGMIKAGGSLLLINREGSAVLTLNGQITDLNPGAMASIAAGSQYSIGTKGEWVRLWKIQSGDFDEKSEQISEGIVINPFIAKQKMGQVQTRVQAQQRSSDPVHKAQRLERSRLLAQADSAQRTAMKSRGGNPYYQPRTVNAAGY